jgi:hypothetical protein
MNQNDWHLMVINNSAQTLSGLTTRTMVFNLDGSRQSSQTNTLTAAPSAATDGGLIAFPENLSPVHFVKLDLRDAQDRLLSDNFYWRSAPEHPDDFTALNTMPAVALDIQATRKDAGGKCLVDVQVHNPSKNIALMTHLQLRKARSGQRILPVYYTDNYISLLPGESKTLVVEAANADLQGDAPLLAVDGWNVTVHGGARSQQGVRVVPNGYALSTAQTGATSINPPQIVGINCSGGPLGFYRFGAPAADVFERDRDFKGGNGGWTTNLINIQVPNAAPAAVYQSERRGACSYTIAVNPSRPCTVRLHFAEWKFEAGGRKFNVDINGRVALSDFDIAAEGGKYKAVVKDFPAITPEVGGNIRIALTGGAADQPAICGIQIIQ